MWSKSEVCLKYIHLHNFLSPGFTQEDAYNVSIRM
jgi:hypothetical protein